jgi:hypothetical protein
VLLTAHLRGTRSTQRLVGDTFRLDATVPFVTGACMGLLTWWLENDHVPYSAEEIHSIFRRLATQGVRRVLAAT